MDAIDHRAAAPVFDQVDLSRAHFEEFWTDADVDNPFAVNLQRAYGGTAGVFGRGFGYFVRRQQSVLLGPGARSSITEATVPRVLPGETWTMARVSATHLLDPVAPETTASTQSASGAVLCAPGTAPRYDRAPAPLSDFLVRKAIRRRSRGTTADGREILQRTRNSARDMELAEPLQRSLAK